MNSVFLQCMNAIVRVVFITRLLCQYDFIGTFWQMYCYALYKIWWLSDENFKAERCHSVYSVLHAVGHSASVTLWNSFT